MSEVKATGRRQIGPTLYWSTWQPKIGEVFEGFDGKVRVVEVMPDPVSGGYLFTTEPA